MIKVSHQDMQVIRQLNNSNTQTFTQHSIYSETHKNLLNQGNPSDMNHHHVNRLNDQDISNVNPSNECGIDQINKIEVYEQFKNQNINKDQLIHLLRDNDPLSTNQKDWLDSNGLYNDEERKKVADEIRSAYTMSTIQNC